RPARARDARVRARRARARTRAVTHPAPLAVRTPGTLRDACQYRAAYLVPIPTTGYGIGKVMIMRVCVAGGSGVLGRRLVPQLVARGHQVTATTTSPGRLVTLEQLGAHAVVMDGLDAASV